MQPNFHTVGCTLLSNIPRQNPRKAQWKYLPVKLCNQVFCVTLRRIQKPFRRQSTFCKFKYTILSKLRVQRKSVLQALYSDCGKWAIHWSIVLARIDFVSLYFHLLWYHSILRGSIDQKHTKTNAVWRQNSEIHSAFACSRWPPWFPDLSRPYGACVKHGSRKHIRSQSFLCESAVKYLHIARRKIQISPHKNRRRESSRVTLP